MAFSGSSVFLFGSPNDPFWYLPIRIKYYLKEAKHDCFFEVGPENGPTEVIGSMKVLLMGDSVPFRLMLQDSALAEEGNSPIRITDIEPKTFRNYLICAYGGSESVVPTLTFEEMVKLLNMADKYLASEISLSVCNHMRKCFFSTLNNFFYVLSHPICYQKKFLENEVLKTLKFDFKKVMMDVKFLELSVTALEWILKQDRCNVRETDMWNAILRWAEHNMGSTDGKVIRKCIFDLLKYLQFLEMEYTEFWENVVPCKVLLDEEVLDICKAFATGEPCSIEHLNQIRPTGNIEVDSEKILSHFMEIPGCAFISCSLSGISSLFTNSKHCSKTYLWAGYLWNMEVVKKKTNNAKQPTKKKYALGVYVKCKGKNSTWKCSINFGISLLNLDKSNLSKEWPTTFSESKPYWGFPNVQEWDVLLDPGKGFVKKDTINLLATMQLRE